MDGMQPVLKILFRRNVDSFRWMGCNLFLKFCLEEMWIRLDSQIY